MTPTERAKLAEINGSYIRTYVISMPLWAVAYGLNSETMLSWACIAGFLCSALAPLLGFFSSRKMLKEFGSRFTAPPQESK